MVAKLTSQENIAYNRLVSLINSMADGVIALDKNAKIVLYNAAALSIFDLNNIQIGDLIDQVFKPVDKNNQSVDIIKMILQIESPTTNRDLKLIYHDGSISSIYLNIAPVHMGYGSEGKEGFVLQLRDITSEKSLEEERDEFISVVAHELRTPIAVAEGDISNAMLLAKNDQHLPIIKKALKEAHNQVIFLADMINDLSTLSRAEKNQLTLEVEPINVVKLIQQLAIDYRTEADKKGLEIKTIIDDRLEILYSSKLYVKEMLQNLITNAIKYTPKGQITISGRQQPKGVEFKVIDTGIGIAKADQERIFDKFFRSEDYRTRQSNGTGLGLYVTMTLARITNAEINFSSELNKGSTFQLYIPNIKKNT